MVDLFIIALNYFLTLTFVFVSLEVKLSFFYLVFSIGAYVCGSGPLILGFFQLALH
jgi:hypothetical protein